MHYDILVPSLLGQHRAEPVNPRRNGPITHQNLPRRTRIGANAGFARHGYDAEAHIAERDRARKEFDIRQLALPTHPHKP